MKLVNLTPHRLVVIDADGAPLLDLPACPDPPRVRQEVLAEHTVGLTGIAVRVIRYGQASELPAPAENVLLVVPRVLAREAPRADLVFPDDEVRGADGQIVACRALARFHHASDVASCTG